MNFLCTIASTEQLPEAAAAFIQHFNGKKVFLFEAEMGTGKTTFIKACCEALGVMDAMSSPTYSIINEYYGAIDRIFHFDLYRIKTIEECMDIGMEEYLYSGAYCFIEWPEIANSLYPEDAVMVKMTTLPDGQRKLEAHEV